MLFLFGILLHVGWNDEHVANGGCMNHYSHVEGHNGIVDILCLHNLAVEGMGELFSSLPSTSTQQSDIIMYLT